MGLAPPHPSCHHLTITGLACAKSATISILLGLVIRSEHQPGWKAIKLCKARFFGDDGPVKQLAGTDSRRIRSAVAQEKAGSRNEMVSTKGQKARVIRASPGRHRGGHHGRQHTRISSLDIQGRLVLLIVAATQRPHCQCFRMAAQDMALPHASLLLSKV